MKKQELHVEPCELTLLASSLAIAISQAFEFEDMSLLRAFFQSVASNISLIENTVKHKNGKQKNSTK